MLVRDVMTRDVRVISPKASIREAAKMMDDLNVGALPVSENNQLIGLITDRDITVRATSAGKHPNECFVRDVMSHDPRHVLEDDGVERAARVMSEVQIRRLPVVNRGGDLVGIVSLGDLATDAGARTAEQALERISEPSEPDRKKVDRGM